MRTNHNKRQKLFVRDENMSKSCNFEKKNSIGKQHKNLLFQIELCHFASLSHYNPHNDMEKIAMAGALMLSKRPLEGLQPSEPGLENDKDVSPELPDIGHSIPPLAFAC